MGASDEYGPLSDRYTHSEGAANVLLLAAAETGAEVTACTQLLGPSEADSTHVLHVGYSSPPGQTRAAIQRRKIENPANTTHVCIGDTMRSTSASATPVHTSSPTATTVEVVEDPTDLAGIGITVNDWLDRREDGDQPVVCFRSLTELLEYVDLQAAFRFLHVLTGRIAAANACAHYHLDPGAHDEQAVNTLSNLFDDVVSIDA